MYGRTIAEKSVLKLTIREYKGNKDVYKLVSEWRERMRAIMIAMTQDVTDDVLGALTDAAPSDAVQGYPGFLRAVQLPEIDGMYITAIVPPGYAFSQRLKQSDADRTVLYIKPKIVKGIAVEQAVVLQRENPWTLDTLPYEPPRQEASILARRVHQKEVRIIEAQRQGNLEKVRQELRELGVQLRPKDKTTLGRRVSRDIAFEVLRYEYGINVPIKSHWRPAIRQIPRFATYRFLEHAAWFSDPADERWKAIRDLPGERASLLEKVQRFQDMVAPGATEKPVAE